jgi:hypothetical protein
VLMAASTEWGSVVVPAGTPLSPAGEREKGPLLRKGLHFQSRQERDRWVPWRNIQGLVAPCIYTEHRSLFRHFSLLSAQMAHGIALGLAPLRVARPPGPTGAQAMGGGGGRRGGCHSGEMSTARSRANPPTHPPTARAAGRPRPAAESAPCPVAPREGPGCPLDSLEHPGARLTMPPPHPRTPTNRGQVAAGGGRCRREGGGGHV